MRESGAWRTGGLRRSSSHHPLPCTVVQADGIDFYLSHRSTTADLGPDDVAVRRLSERIFGAFLRRDAICPATVVARHCGMMMAFHRAACSFLWARTCSFTHSVQVRRECGGHIIHRP